jgi:pimeloyl-ACP methyl ester carboxylesterase
LSIDNDVIGRQLRDKAPAIRSLLAWGSYDVFVPAASAPEAMIALPPRTDLVMLEAAGHAPYLEQPDRFNSVVIDFLTQR